jgi:hypothetical protein
MVEIKKESETHLGHVLNGGLILVQKRIVTLEFTGQPQQHTGYKINMI